MLTHEIEEVRQHIKEVQGLKMNVARELEVVRRERNFMSESMKELKRMLHSADSL